jgi:hypothetical protein
VGQHLGVGVGDQLDARVGERRPEGGGVVEDAVVDDRDPAPAAGAR